MGCGERHMQALSVTNQQLMLCDKYTHLQVNAVGWGVGPVGP